MPPNTTSLVRSVAVGLLAALSGCDSGLPQPEPATDAKLSSSVAVTDAARPDAHFGIELLFRHGGTERTGGEGLETPVAAPAEAMAHDLALWSFTTAGGRLADIVPIEALALVAIDVHPTEAPAGAITGGASQPVTTPEASGISREAWRLELWRPPAGDAPATLLGVQLERSLTAGPPVLAPPLRAERAAADGAPAGRDGGLALWNDDGTLTARGLSLHPEAAGDTSRHVIAARADRLAYMSTDTHRLVGAPVVTLASRDPARRYLVCARENVSGLMCANMSDAGEVDAWSPVPGLGTHTPVALTRVADGFVGLALGCSLEADEGSADAACTTGPAASFHLDAEGALRGKRGVTQLGTLAQQRPVTVVETGDGLLVSARRARPDAQGVWHLTAEAARPREDALGRLLGGVRLTPGGVGSEADDGLADEAEASEVWLLDASPLVMRGGFPVALPRPARWSAGRGREKHVAWPARIAEVMPGHRGEPVVARERFLAFSHAPRADALTVTCLHFEPNGAPPSPPEAAARPAAKRKARKKGR